jgi:hypothetical protein
VELGHAIRRRDRLYLIGRQRLVDQPYDAGHCSRLCFGLPGFDGLFIQLDRPFPGITAKALNDRVVLAAIIHWSGTSTHRPTCVATYRSQKKAARCCGTIGNAEHCVAVPSPAVRHTRTGSTGPSLPPAGAVALSPRGSLVERSSPVACGTGLSSWGPTLSRCRSLMINQIYSMGQIDGPPTEAGLTLSSRRH